MIGVIDNDKYLLRTHFEFIIPVVTNNDTFSTKSIARPYISNDVDVMTDMIDISDYKSESIEFTYSVEFITYQPDMPEIEIELMT